MELFELWSCGVAKLLICGVVELWSCLSCGVVELLNCLSC